MTSVKVVDASALASIVFGEDTAEAMAERLEQSRLLAPTLLDFEMANICKNKLRTEKTQRGEILSSFAERGRIVIERVDVDIDDMLELAIQSGLSAYDASYLWVARQYDAELVTLDKRLNTAFLSPTGR
jgi:predicted nucleic acid-binding protein